MEDIFHWCREGNSLQVRVWLDDTEHDMNQGLVLGFLNATTIYGGLISNILQHLNVMVSFNFKWVAIELECVKAYAMNLFT